MTIHVPDGVAETAVENMFSLHCADWDVPDSLNFKASLELDQVQRATPTVWLEIHTAFGGVHVEMSLRQFGQLQEAMRDVTRRSLRDDGTYAYDHVTIEDGVIAPVCQASPRHVERMDVITIYGADGSAEATLMLVPRRKIDPRALPAIRSNLLALEALAQARELPPAEAARPETDRVHTTPQSRPAEETGLLPDGRRWSARSVG
jgi:hypothetical protein